MQKDIPPTEAQAKKAGALRLTAAQIKKQIVGNTVSGLYRGGWRFVSYTDQNYKMEGRNHTGAHNFGICSFEDDEDTLTVSWDNGWDPTTTRAYSHHDILCFYDVHSQLLRNTFSNIKKGKQPLTVS